MLRILFVFVSENFYRKLTNQAKKKKIWKKDNRWKEENKKIVEKTFFRKEKGKIYYGLKISNHSSHFLTMMTSYFKM